MPRGLIERIRASRPAEQRVIGGVPWRPWDNPFVKFNVGGPVHPSRSFYGQDEALGLPALYSGTRLLADSIASLPIKVYTRATANSRPIRYRGPTIFDQPSVTGTIFDWLFTAMTSLVLHGNAWGFITGRDGYGFPTGIEWIPPDDVTCVDDEMQPWNPLRTRIYVYGRQMDRTELFHIKAFSVAGRTEGISPLRAFALTILNGMEAQRYGTDWFRSGGFPPGTFQNTEIEIDADQAEEIRESLSSTIRRRVPLVFGRDWDYKPVVIPPNEAQFIQAMQMNATQIAAVLGLPPDRIGGTRGDSLTYNTVEQSTLQVIDALRPWLVRLENAFFQVLPQQRYVRFDTDALLKTDLQTRMQIYTAQRNIGLRTTDELRELEDLEPLPGQAGGETIPLEVMVAMSRSIRGIPNSMLPGITLEMDLAVDRLENLEKQGLAADTGQPMMGPDQVLGQIITSQRSFDPQEREDASTILDYLVSRRRGRSIPKTAPEYVGAWIPAPHELVLDGSSGGSGLRTIGAAAAEAWSGVSGTYAPDQFRDQAQRLARELFDLEAGIADPVLSPLRYRALVNALREARPIEHTLSGANGTNGSSVNHANGTGRH